MDLPNFAVAVVLAEQASKQSWSTVVKEMEVES